MRAKLLALVGACLLIGTSACSGQTTSTNPSSDVPSTSGATSKKTSESFKDHWNIVSPDGTLECSVNFTEYGEIYYEVTKDGVTVLEQDSISFLSKECDFCTNTGVFMLKGQPVVTDEFVLYDNISGRSATVEYDYSELALTTWDGGDFDFTVTFRLFDDGFGFNYQITRESLNPGVNDVISEVSENTNFAFPEKTKVWTQNYKEITTSNVHHCFAYEEEYVKSNVYSLNTEYASLPFTAKIGTSDIYMTMQESGLIGSGFYGSMLTGDGIGESENTVMHLEHTPASVCLEKESEFEITLPFSSPWRVMAIGDLETITDTEIYEAILGDVEVYDPDPDNPINYEEFVDPAVSTWSWLRYNGDRTIGGETLPWQKDFDLHESYLTTTIELGFKYYLLDAGWDSAPNAVIKIRRLSERAHANGVKLLGWDYAYNARDSKAFKSRMATWKSYGIDGIKIDFFDGQLEADPSFQGEDKEMLVMYENVYKSCAELGMTVNCHGANKPTGERRMYPNVINREAIKGYENTTRLSSKSLIDSMYNRAVVGPTDFTPTIRPFGENISAGALIGTTVCYESGQTSAASSNGYNGQYNEYNNDDVNEYYSELPSRWDASKFVSGELDDHYCVARKNDNNWFVGCVARRRGELEVKFDFLKEGDTYSALIISDGGDYATLDVKRVTINSHSVETINVIDNGGFAIKLIKQ